MFEYTDSSSGNTFIFNYIVTQFEDEGPEQMEYQMVDEDPETGKSIIDPTGWKHWPDDMPLPSEVSGHFFGERVPSEDFDVPTMFETFSRIRAVKDDLKNIRMNNGVSTQFNMILHEAIGIMETYGDLDENYILIAKAALDGDPVARGQLNKLIEA